MKSHGWWMVCCLQLLVVLGYCGPGALLQAGEFKKAALIQLAQEAVAWAEGEEALAKTSLDKIQASCDTKTEDIRAAQHKLNNLERDANRDSWFANSLGLPDIEASRCALRVLGTAATLLGAGLEQAQQLYDQKVAQRQAAQEHLENLTVRYFAAAVAPDFFPYAGVRIVEHRCV